MAFVELTFNSLYQVKGSRGGREEDQRIQAGSHHLVLISFIMKLGFGTQGNSKKLNCNSVLPWAISFGINWRLAEFD